MNHNNYLDNIIFSEDDRDTKKIIDIKSSLLNSESDNENLELIRVYVLALTNDIVNEVCRRAESFSRDSPPKKEEEITENTQNNSDLYNMGALP